MSTRSIVTSQPDVACDVCERRLLRGEQWDVFLAAGQRRTVCELCAPRAMHAGWLRESDHDAVGAPAPRPRRRRGLFGRLRQAGPSPGESPAPGRGVAPGEAGPEGLRDPVEGVAGRSRATPVPARGRAGGSLTGGGEAPTGAGVLEGEPGELTSGGGRAERAVDAFNASEHPRRVSGLTRSLGAPEVNVRPDEEVQHLVSIVIAWELCWYRYEVDVDEQPAVVKLVDQGTELEEIAAGDRLANGVADELGALSLSAGRGA